MRRLLFLIVTLFFTQIICGCNNELRFIETGYEFEHINGYTPDRYFSKDSLSFGDYQKIASKYTKKFGQPLYTGDQDDAILKYNKTVVDPELLHQVLGYATDAEYYTIYKKESTYLLIMFSHYCGVYIFK